MQRRANVVALDYRLFPFFLNLVYLHPIVRALSSEFYNGCVCGNFLSSIRNFCP